VTSARSSPRSRAKWLRVPAGTQTNATSCRRATSATRACEPSPPAIPITSAPPATACSASARRSSPRCSTTGATPRRRASSSRPNRSTFRPPDHGFMIRTPCPAGPTKRAPAAAGARSWPIATRAAAVATRTSRTTATIRNTEPANNRTTAASSATAAAALAATRRPPSFTSAVHAATTAKTTSSTTSTSTSGSRRKVDTATTAAARRASSAPAAARRRAVDGGGDAVPVACPSGVFMPLGLLGGPRDDHRGPGPGGRRHPARVSPLVRRGTPSSKRCAVSAPHCRAGRARGPRAPRACDCSHRAWRRSTARGS
jgi:hypothetical protein